jgi:hypothetical protein
MSGGEFHQRITSANDPGTTETTPQNTHHVASEDADHKGILALTFSFSILHFNTFDRLISLKDLLFSVI